MPCEPNHLAFIDAFRNGDLQLAFHFLGVAVGIELYAAQTQYAHTAVVAVWYFQLNAGVLVLTAHVRWWPAVATRTLGSAKQFFKKAAVVCLPVGVAVLKFPARRRLKAGAIASVLLIAAGIAEFVIGFALFGVREHGVGFVDLCHPGRSVWLFADVRVVFACQLAKCFLMSSALASLETPKIL